MTAIGRFQIKRTLTENKHAQVLLAFDPDLARDVVLKLLPVNALSGEEARITAQLDAVPVVPVYESAEWHGQPYFVMRYMRGGTLAARLRTGALPIAAIIPILDQVTLVLTTAHALGIVHCDLKPSNILFDGQDRAYVADFGTAQLSAETRSSSQRTSGTPPYMAPEQWRGDVATPQTDIYQVGVLLFQMLTGSLPFHLDGDGSYEVAHCIAPIPSVATFTTHLPLDYDSFFCVALAKDPQQRFASISALQNAFLNLMTGNADDAITDPIPTPSLDQALQTDGETRIAEVRLLDCVGVWLLVGVVGWGSIVFLVNQNVRGWAFWIGGLVFGGLAGWLTMSVVRMQMGRTRLPVIRYTVWRSGLVASVLTLTGNGLLWLVVGETVWMLVIAWLAGGIAGWLLGLWSCFGRNQRLISAVGWGVCNSLGWLILFA